MAMAPVFRGDGFNAEGRHRGEGQAHADSHGHGAEDEMERLPGEPVAGQGGRHPQKPPDHQEGAVFHPVAQVSEGQAGDGVHHALDGKDQADLPVGQPLGVGMQGQVGDEDAQPEAAPARGQPGAQQRLVFPDFPDDGPAQGGLDGGSPA